MREVGVFGIRILETSILGEMKLLLRLTLLRPWISPLMVLPWSFERGERLEKTGKGRMEGREKGGFRVFKHSSFLLGDKKNTCMDPDPDLDPGPGPLHC